MTGHGIQTRAVTTRALPGFAFVDPFGFAFGSQLTRGQMKYRIGYSYNTNPINHNVGASLSQVPVVQSEIYLLQAATSAVINQHRLSAGFGRENILPGLDLDFFAGGLFKASDQFGPNTEATVAVWYIGTGLTWRFGGKSSLPARTLFRAWSATRRSHGSPSHPSASRTLWPSAPRIRAQRSAVTRFPLRDPRRAGVATTILTRRRS